MAEMIKEIKTRVALRTGDYAYWTTGAGKDIELYKGEVCVCTLAENTGKVVNAPTVLFKVCHENGKKFAELDWVSGLAADVYGWAKATEADHIAWLKTNHADLDTRYSFSTSGDKLVVKKTLYTNGVAGTEESVGEYEFLSEGEVRTILADYYTKEEVDALIEGVEAKIPTELGVMSVAAANGAIEIGGTAKDPTVGVKLNPTQGNVTLSVDGGLKASVVLPTSADYGVLEVKGDEASGVVVDKTDAQRPVVKIAANTYDAHGAAAAVLGTSADAASANTVYGAKAAAAAAQSDATIAKTKIETFLGTVTPDGSQDIIDTLAEINSYVGEHGEEFATLSGKVTNIENGTTVVPKATDANTLDGHDSTYFATAESVENISNNLGALAYKDTVATDDIDNKAVTKEKLADAVAQNIDNAITFVDYHQNEGDNEVFIRHWNQNGTAPCNGHSIAGSEDTVTVNLGSSYEIKIDLDDKVKTSLGKADTAIQKLEYGTGIEITDNPSANEYTVALSAASIASLGKADTALQEITTTEGHGLKVTNRNNIDIDTDVVFVLNCNW